MALRWGLTLGAYNKYCFIFDKELPIRVNVPSGSISQASYIRDVIRFAHDNNLKGGDWYGKVKVSAEENCVLISHKSGISAVSNYPVHTIIELLAMADELRDGYTCIVSDGLEELASVAEGLELSYIHLGNNTVRFNSQESTDEV